MFDLETLEGGTTGLATRGAEDELKELGCVSRETRGLFFGIFTELSILPLRLF